MTVEKGSYRWEAEVELRRIEFCAQAGYAQSALVCS